MRDDAYLFELVHRLFGKMRGMSVQHHHRRFGLDVAPDSIFQLLQELHEGVLIGVIFQRKNKTTVTLAADTAHNRYTFAS